MSQRRIPSSRTTWGSRKSASPGIRDGRRPCWNHYAPLGFIPVSDALLFVASAVGRPFADSRKEHRRRRQRGRNLRRSRRRPRRNRKRLRRSCRSSQGDRLIHPGQTIGAGSVPPVHRTPLIAVRMVLIEEVPSASGIREPVRVVHPVARAVKWSAGRSGPLLPLFIFRPFYETYVKQ